MRNCLLLLIVLLVLSTLTYPQQGGMGPGPGNKTYTTGETNFVNDTFTEPTSNTELSLHTPELGGPWAEHLAAVYGASTVNASLDRAYPTTDPSAYVVGSPPSADYCSEAVVVVVSIVSANAAITVRADETDNTMYIFQLNNGTGWRVRKIVTGTQTTLGTEDTTTNIPGVGESRTMKLCAIGTTISAYVNGSLLVSPGGSDSSISAAGQPGVRFAGPINETAGYHFTSFRAFTP